MAATNGFTVPCSASTPLDPLTDHALVLESARLRLRPLSGEDLDLGEALFLDPEVVRYVCDLSTPESVPNELETACKRGAGGRLGVWCVLNKATGEKLGTCVLLPLPVDEEDTDWSLLVADQYPDADIEIGYMLKRSAWGHGYATEACSRLLRFAFEHTLLDEVVACTDPENRASQNVLRKSGLQDRGEIRCYGSHAPGFGISRAEWLARHENGQDGSL